MIKAVARAFRWWETPETEAHATIADLARAERIVTASGAHPAADAAGSGSR
jgi:hypothetical protein